MSLVKEWWSFQFSFHLRKLTNKNVSRLSQHKRLAESLCADSMCCESSSSAPCCNVTESSSRCQNFVGKIMKYIRNVSSPKYQMVSHGKHGNIWNSSTEMWITFLNSKIECFHFFLQYFLVFCRMVSFKLGSSSIYTSQA